MELTTRIELHLRRPTDLLVIFGMCTGTVCQEVDQALYVLSVSLVLNQARPREHTTLLPMDPFNLKQSRQSLPIASTQH